MEKIKSLLRRCSCFASTCDAGSDDNAYHVDTISKMRSPSPSPSRESINKIPDNTSLVIAHGAFHTVHHYHLVGKAVIRATQRSAGSPQVTKVGKVIIPAQSSSGPTPPTNCFGADVKLFHDTIVSELLSNRDVLLVCHSYGSIPACEALVNLPTASPGKIGRLLGIVFISAFVAEAGQSLVTAKTAGRASWVKIDGPLSYALDAEKNFYNMINPEKSPGLASFMARSLVPQASPSFTTPTTHDEWKAYPCFYIRCTNDVAMVPAEQDFFIAKLQRLQPETKIEDLPEADHVPFASRPDEVVALLDDIIRELHGEKRHGAGDRIKH